MKASITEIHSSIRSFLDQSDYQDHHHPRQKLKNEHILLIHVVACLDYGGNYSHCMHRLNELGYLPEVIDKSRLSRRLRHLQSAIREFEVYRRAKKKGLENSV